MLVEGWLKTGLMNEYPEIAQWSAALLADERVIGSVPDNFEEEFVGNLQRRGLYVADLIPQAAAG